MPFTIGSNTTSPHRAMDVLDGSRELMEAYQQAYLDEVLEGKFYPLPTLGDGFRFPVPDFTLKIRCGFTAAELMPIMNSVGGTLITQAVIDIIEDIEPGVHQYFPVQLVLRSGEPQPEPYFQLNVCTREKTLDYERSAITFSHMPEHRHHIRPYQLYDVREEESCMTYYTEPSNINRPPKLFCHADKIKGRALWYEYGYAVMFSDDFVERVNALVGKGLFDGFAGCPNLMLKLFIGVSE